MKHVHVRCNSKHQTYADTSLKDASRPMSHHLCVRKLSFEQTSLQLGFVAQHIFQSRVSDESHMAPYPPTVEY